MADTMRVKEGRILVSCYILIILKDTTHAKLEKNKHDKA